MQNSADLLAQLNKLPSPSMVDPHSSTTTTSESSLTYPNPFGSEVRLQLQSILIVSQSTNESTIPPDDTIKSIMSMYPGSEPKTQGRILRNISNTVEQTSWRPPTGYPSLDSWPTYQVSPKPEAKSAASPVPSPIQSRPADTTEPKSTSDTAPNYSAPSQYPSYASPKPETRSEQTQQPNYGASTQSSYQTNPATTPTYSTTAPTTATTTTTTSPSTPSYQSPQSGYQLNSTNYQAPQQQQQQASTNHVVQYPLYQQQPQQSTYTQPSSTTQSPQVLLSQIEKLQQQNQQQQQMFQQHLSQQIQMQKQLSAIQQTESVTKEFIDKMQANFTKIMGFMESVDQRLSNLEKVTQSILHNQNSGPVAPKTTTTTTVSTMPHPPPAISFPSYAVPMPSYSNSGSVYPSIQTADEADAVRKIEQFEEDQKLAKRLQEELELEAKRSSTSSSSKSSSSTTSTKKPTPKKEDESAICPICSTQISLAEIETHADKCLEATSATKPTPQEKAGFFAKLFGSKDAAAATPTPAPTPVATKPTTPAPTKPTTTTATTPAMQPATVAHMPTTMPTAFQPGPGNPNGQFYQMPYAMYNTAYTPYGYSQYPPPGTGQQQGYYYYPGQQPPNAQNPKKN